ncbi:S-adenosylmethionine-dependent methyltransferase Rv2258c-like [Ylistrum balloti]|uniref:S-adenosylmethionine-dependent methyltransferase Rv2258c-like n=1 Tax=Ylistrum balloti TaxID=509963 RepID=UPI002905AAAF|nr:S-adenosylmethionine-dependent methyltransferase Rv2258c-like [Ylistrum balloti]
MDLETYSNNITTLISGSYITSAITIGKELGLFDELKRLDKPVSSLELAEACDLKERYVREWLGCMVATKIVSIDDSDHYYIPQSLKEGLKATNMVFLYPLLGTLTESAKECFKKTGPKGLSYADMPADLVDLTERKTVNPGAVVEDLLPPITKSLGSVKTILDLGCGGGNITLALSKRFPDADIYAVDYSETAITRATAIAKAEGIKNVTFVKEDVTSLPSDWTGKFDWVILFDVLHDLPDHINAMKEVHRVLKDDGVTSIVDPDVHSHHRDNVGDTCVAGIGYSISCLVCLPCSSSIEGAVCHGIGWGTENKEAFLKSTGWKVEDKRSLGSPFALNFTCVKA